MFLLVGLVCGFSLQRALTSVNEKILELRVVVSNMGLLFSSGDEESEEFESSDYERVKEEKVEVEKEVEVDFEKEEVEDVLEDKNETVNETEIEISVSEEPVSVIEPVVELIESDVETVCMAPFVRVGRKFLKAFRTLGIPKQGRKWQVKGNRANFTVTFDACSVRGVSLGSSRFKDFHVDGVEGKIVNNTFHFSKPQTLERLKLVIESGEGAEKTCVRQCEVLC